MTTYTAPLPDIRFVLTRLIGLERLAELHGFEAVGSELVEAVLDETAKIASEVFAPLNQLGDRSGATLIDGAAKMPIGFKEAYRAFIDGGWNGLPVEEQWGGQGLPWSIAMPVQEMLQAANISLALCTLLNQGAIEAVSIHGSEELKKLYLPKLVSGEWTGVMNLTEPQAGSDVGAVNCRAKRTDSHYLLSGQKIFISYGDHDMTENVIHLVLARLPNAPPGTKGLSLFLVPKILLDAQGELKDKNDVRVVSLEHKLGLHASPTCVMAYGDRGGAVGFLVGKEHDGMSAMFTMMNNARIGVGLQGLALMERSYQQALDYAKTRLQGKGLTRTGAPNAQEVPVSILHHPDVRRMLLLMRCQIEASRALVYDCAWSIDVSKRGATSEEKSRHARRVDLLTPVIKAWLTDLSNEVTSLGVQVFGGMGYIEETGIAQHMRDARVLGIYEGTNGIQANDLVFRKLARDSGEAFGMVMGEMIAVQKVVESKTGDDFSSMSASFSNALSALEKAEHVIIDQARNDPNLAACGAAVFLRLFGSTLGGYQLIRSACLADDDLRSRVGDPDFLEAKIVTARFYAEHILSQCEGLASAVIRGGRVIASTEKGYFS